MTDTRINNLNAQRKFAWAKVYEKIAEKQELYEKVKAMREALTAEMPKHFVDQFVEMADALKREFNCPICLEDVKKDAFAVSSCGHIYCKDCLTQVLAQAEPKCSLCRKKLYKKA